MPPRIPICAFDAKTGILCAKCQAKLDAGEIRETDIEVSRALVTLSEKAGEVNKMALLKSAKIGGNYVLEMEQSDAVVMRSKPELKRKLEELLKGRVWVMAASSSDRRFLEDIFYPIRLLTVNTVWLPDGNKVTKAIIPGRRVDRLNSEIQLIKDMVKKVRGIELAVEFEREATLRL